MCVNDSAWLLICDEIKRKNPKNPVAFYIHGNILHTQNLLKEAERNLFFAIVHFKQRFEIDRESSIKDWINLVSVEHKQVKEKLANQTYNYR